jgi:hypothetical protein
MEMMSVELSDLPADSVLAAMDAWIRGDDSHLSQYEQERVRVGVFIPRPAELRDIVRYHRLRERERREQLEREERDAAEARDRMAHPENYCTLEGIFKEVEERKRLRLLEKPASSNKVPLCQTKNGKVFCEMSPTDRELAENAQRALLALIARLDAGESGDMAQAAQ